MATKYLLAVTFVLASNFLPFFKIIESVDAVYILDEPSEAEVQEKIKDNIPKFQNGKSISFNYAVTTIEVLHHIIVA